MSIDKVEHLRMIATKHMPDEFDCWFVPSTAVMKDLCEAACELADLIESREKAEPVYEVVGFGDHHKAFKGDIDLRDLPVGTKLYTHPSTTPTGVTQVPVVEAEKAINDALVYGSGFMLGVKHIPHGDVFVEPPKQAPDEEPKIECGVCCGVGVLGNPPDDFYDCPFCIEDSEPPKTPTDVQTPFDSIKAAIQKDGEYSWSWHCNITMPMVDTGLIGHATANHCAAAVMRFLFNVEPAHELPKQTPVVDEQQGANPAPANSLPDWSECSMRVGNSEYIAKRKAEGGYGADYDSKLANHLHYFIYEYDDSDPYKSSWFMHRLELAINEAKQQGFDEARAKLGQAVVPDERRPSGFDDCYGADALYNAGWNDCRAAMLKGGEMTLGELIKSKRNTAQLSLEELSELAGVSKSYLHAIENNESCPSIYICAKLSLALGVSVQSMALAVITNSVESKTSEPENV